jgi:hypothetical protein
MNNLSNRQKLISAITGIVLWFVFMTIIRNVPWVFDGGIRSIILFLAAIPLNFPLIAIVKSVVGLNEHTLFEGMVIATFAAMLFDGGVFTFVSQWYGATTQHALFGAGFILWGAAWGMIVAWFRYVRNTSTQQTTSSKQQAT